MRAFTTQESVYVRDNWGRLSVDEMARGLGRTWQSVYQHGHGTLRLGSCAPGDGPNRNRRWGREDDALLEMLSARGVPMGVIAQVMGRSAGACRRRTYAIKERKLS